MQSVHARSESPEPTPGCSRPLHVKRLEQALDLRAFLKQYPTTDEDDDDSDLESDDDGSDENAIKMDILMNDADTQYKREFYNAESLTGTRAWLGDVLQEDSSDSDDYNPEEHYHEILKAHVWRKRVAAAGKNINQSMYYGAGTLSNYDKYCEQQKKPPVFPSRGVKRKATPRDDYLTHRSPLYGLDTGDYDEPCVDLNLEAGIDMQNFEDDSNINCDLPVPPLPSHHLHHHPLPSSSSSMHMAAPTAAAKRRGKKAFKDEESRKKWEDVMTLKRKKVFTSIVKKEIGKQHRAKISRHKEQLIQCKRVALQCQKAARQKALQSARTVKEQLWRMKRLARENIAYWKRSKRVDREIRRKMEKEAEEQRKMDFELIEAKRQQRKLNFLITQTELYAHFMSKKIGSGSTEEQLRILSQLDEEKNPRLSSIDDYDSEQMKAKAKRNAHEAFQSERARTRHFDKEAHAQSATSVVSTDGEHAQPAIFRGSLKGYQLRGMNWLANLYDQGISGILADEMGLGKTIQSIAFLCHVAERYSVWGPFLIISPASTLHNWQQELDRFVPDFKVIPYWGTPHERKILRQFWGSKDLHTKKASFHVVITSYQIVITDIKYFNRVKWQYMILDEAQAIKSTTSMRWKTLLGFSCRNRLLLSGTPIQNSMAELWALLHFIMPTLFDSHEEFNEWFSKDIESHAENKTGIDEKHLSRLHMILKPFMLRRIKKDVENELSDKIEVMVYCPLTTRQRLLYMALKQKIRIEDLLHYTVGGGDSHAIDKSFTSNLMNLVMQFRKVCNHPELFERRDAKSPIFLQPHVYAIPRLVFENDIRYQASLVLQKLFILSTSEYVARNFFEDSSIFNFCASLKLSFDDVQKIFREDIAHRWKVGFEMEKKNSLQYVKMFWGKTVAPSLKFDYGFKFSKDWLENSQTFKDLVFTNKTIGSRVVYTHNTHCYHSMPETVEHRKIRMKNTEDNDDDVFTKNALPYKKRPAQIFHCQRTELPAFLFCVLPKVETVFQLPYCYSRRAAWRFARHILDCSYGTLAYYWSNVVNAGVTVHQNTINPVIEDPLERVRPRNGWSHITIPDKETLVTDSGKLSVLDGLLKRLKEEGHRVLIYSQMTKMIDLLEEYMWHRHHKYMRLDGSSKISERRDMVADFQARTDIFVFLLSTRAGGLGINLTAADTVIFYDSDWNPTVDQQAMDRAHRLGQTKQVTVYRLICKGSIEERILQRAREKSEIQKLVISGGNFKPDTLKPKEVVSLLLDDEEIEQKYRQKTEERKHLEDMRENDRKRKQMMAFKTVSAAQEAKKVRMETTPYDAGGGGEEPSTSWAAANVDSGPNSPHSDNSPDDVADGNYLDVEGESSITSKYTVYNIYGTTVKPRLPGRGAAKRGRPRGSRRINTVGRFTAQTSSNASSADDVTPLPSGSSSTTTGSGLLETTSTPMTTSGPPLTTLSVGGISVGAAAAAAATIRRGPGRPRLKPGGPPNVGSRGAYRPRKPARPLPVPLPTDGAAHATPGGSSVSYTSYLYDFQEANDL